MTAIDQGDANQYFQHNHYRYDNLGREFATWRDEDGGKGEHFSYNAANQLTRAVYKADNVSTGNPSNWATFRDYHYAPDLLNWTAVNANGYWAPFANSPLNQYTSVNSFVPSYDGNFNQTTGYYGATFSYNAENQLVGGSMEATYDGLGRCVRRTGGGTTTLFTYDGWTPILEWDQWGNRRVWNVYGVGPDDILVRWDATHGTLFYKQDRRGSVTFLLDGGNRVIEKYTYDAYGRPEVTSWDYGTGTWKAPSDRSSFGNRFAFTGREWIAELSVYDYRHRLYDPDSGRFLQGDPIGFAAGDANLFRYCGGDPINRTDPLGLAGKDNPPKNKNRDPKEIPGHPVIRINGEIPVIQTRRARRRGSGVIWTERLLLRMAQEEAAQLREVGLAIVPPTHMVL